MLNKVLKFIITISSLICFISIIIGSYLQHKVHYGYGKFLIIFIISFVVLLITTVLWNIKNFKNNTKDKEI